METKSSPREHKCRVIARKKERTLGSKAPPQCLAEQKNLIFFREMRIKRNPSTRE